MLYYHSMFVCSLQLCTWKCINWPIRHIWADLIQNTVQYCNASLDQSDTLHTHCCHLDVWRLVYKQIFDHERDSWEKLNCFFLAWRVCMLSIVMYLKMYQLTNSAHLGRLYTKYCPVLQGITGSIWNFAHTLLPSSDQHLHWA